MYILWVVFYIMGSSIPLFRSCAMEYFR